MQPATIDKGERDFKVPHSVAKYSAEHPYSFEESFSHITTQIREKIPFTIRALALIATIAILILGPVRGESDLLAAGVSLAISLILAVLFIVGLFTFLFYRRKMGRFPLTLVAGQESVLAQKEIPLELALPPLFLPFGFYLSLRPLTALSKSPCPALSLGSWTGTSRATITTTFPHRGLWRFYALESELHDYFSLFAQTFQIPLQGTVRVEIPHRDVRSLPIIASEFTNGDQQELLTKRTGDPLDLKRYQPADGARRIVWRIFARSQELMSRVEETTASPVGKSVLFTLADKKDDITAAYALSYAQRLEEQRVQVIANCSGSSKPVIGASAFHESLLNAVWQKHTNTDSLEALLTKESKIQTLLLFIPARFLAQDELWITVKNLFALLGHRQVRAHVFIENEQKLKIIQTRIVALERHGKVEVLW